MKKNSRGFTLLELMIVVAVVAILATIAYPSYQGFVLRSHRAEAIEGLLSAQLRQEEWRVKNGTYTNDITKIGISASTYYAFTATASSSGVPTYTLTATASGSQTSDTDCPTLTITNADVKGPSASCWQ
ncbi:MAG: type IV pilin protein [Gammaproteobacteria bacterium]|nr:type IV pilin protein [Gammaproteobacteria bacterium]